jgi:tetratricopeptide (TPR) repeat protein
MNHLPSLLCLKDHVLGVTLHAAFSHATPPKSFPKSSVASSFILKPAVIDFSTPDSLSQHGLDLLAAGSSAEAAQAFRSAIAADPAHVEAHHGLIRALRDAGQINQSIAAAKALTTLTPNDPLAHTAMSISLQRAGRIPEAEAAAGRARILEWKLQLQSPSSEDSQP